MIGRRLAAALTIAALAPVAWAAAREVSPGVWEGVDRVVAVGDVHGSYDKFTRILVAAGLTDEQGNWTGGADHLVLPGDFTDRGPRERDVLDLLRRLQDQSAAAGGRVHALLGNHEVMNLVRDLRYIAAEGFAAFAGDESARERKRVRKAWVEEQTATGTDRGVAEATFDKRYPRGFLARCRAIEDGEYGAWLLEQPVTVKIDGVLFVHGGIRPQVASLGIETINRMAQDGVRDYRQLRRVLEDRGRLGPTSYYRDQQAVARSIVDGAEGSEAAGEEDAELRAAAAGMLAFADSLIFGPQGPLWHRAYSQANERYERGNLAAALEALGARAMVVGHTITANGAISARFSGTLYRIDTGMAYGGDPQALILTAGSARVLDALDGSTGEPFVEPPAGQEVAAESPDPARLRALLEGAPPIADRTSGGPEAGGGRLLHLRQDGVSVTAVFWGTDDLASHRRATQELAAFALDRMLGLNLVPPTATREIDGVAGGVQHVDDRAIDGQSVDERAIALWDAEDVARQRARAAVFDALIGNCRRPSTEVLYLPEERRMLLVNHSRAFAISLLAGCGDDAPVPSIDDELRLALEALTAERLTADLGGWLSEQQIAAVVARRERLLAGRSAVDPVAAGAS